MQRAVTSYQSKKFKRYIIDHCMGNHGNELLKYRNKLRLNENSGKFIYQTRLHEYVIPSNVVIGCVI